MYTGELSVVQTESKLDSSAGIVDELNQMLAFPENQESVKKTKQDKNTHQKIHHTTISDPKDFWEKQT